MLRRCAFPAWFFIVLDLFPDTFSACMRCVNFNFVYFWSYPDLFPHTEKRHLSYLSNILQKEKSAEKSALFHLLSLLPWHQYHALNVPRYPWIDNICRLLPKNSCIRKEIGCILRLWEEVIVFCLFLERNRCGKIKKRGGRGGLFMNVKAAPLPFQIIPPKSNTHPS